MWDLSYLILLNKSLKYSCILALQKEEYAHMLAVNCVAVLRANSLSLPYHEFILLCSEVWSFQTLSKTKERWR